MTPNSVPVTVAMAAYHHAYEIAAGLVPLAGMSPTFVSASTADADIRDMPLSDYVALRAGGDTSLTAVPVFLARAFVHSWIQVADEGSEETPVNTTASVYARGLLSERGDAPGTVVITPPVAARDRRDLHPFYEDAGSAEREYYARTGVYPILSVLAIKTELISRERWLASNVFRAFEIVRRRYFGRLQDIRGSRAPIPSIAGYMLELGNLFGPELWPHGLEPNRAALEAFVRYAAEQGVIGQAPADVAELFAPVEPFVDFTDGI